MSQGLLNNVEGISTEGTMLNPEIEELESIEEQELDPLQELLVTLEGYQNAPNSFDLEQWKDLHGMFFASSVNGEDMYIWRTLKRLEYKSIAQSGAMEKQDLLENSIVRKCLLWPHPSPDFFASSDAGIIPTLFKQIMHKSGFVSDEIAISMIRRV